MKDAVEESECELQPSITDSLASGRDPARDGRGTSDEHNERGDRFHVWHKEYDGEKRERSANHAARDSQSSLVERCLSALERNERAGDERRMDSRPIDRLINDVAEHRCESDFEGEMHVRRVRERVRHKESFRFRMFSGRLRRVRQKQQVQHDGDGDGVRQCHP